MVVSMNSLNYRLDNRLILHHKEAHLKVSQVNSKQKPLRQEEAQMCVILTATVHPSSGSYLPAPPRPDGNKCPGTLIRVTKAASCPTAPAALPHTMYGV